MGRGIGPLPIIKEIEMKEIKSKKWWYRVVTAPANQYQIQFRCVGFWGYLMGWEACFGTYSTLESAKEYVLNRVTDETFKPTVVDLGDIEK